MKLIIFDLDQTLVEVLAIHDESACRLFMEFFNVCANFSDVEYAGRSMQDNFIQMGNRHGVDTTVINEKMPDLIAHYDRIFTDRIINDAAKYILPGVVPLLENLAKTDSIVVLYTGDSRPVGESILKSTGLAKYFLKTFHATEVQERADMIQQAINWAYDNKGIAFKGNNIVVIGDSIRDIECGHYFHTRTISVATGYYDIKRLAEEKPDYIFKNLEDYRAVIKAIFS